MGIVGGPGKDWGPGHALSHSGRQGKKDTLVKDIAASEVKEVLFFYFWRLSGIPVPPGEGLQVEGNQDQMELSPETQISAQYCKGLNQQRKGGDCSRTGERPG